MSGGYAAGVGRGVRFIASQQQPDGRFLSFSSATQKPFHAAITLNTTFAPAIMLTALTAVTADEVRSVCDKLATWLVGQKNENGALNYWATDAPERRSTPYPDDLDDTFCTLIGLHAHNPANVDSAWLAQAVRLLLATESQVGGPYRTWLVPETAAPQWRDVDLAVNANVNGYLRRVAEPLPNLTQMFEQAIAAEQLTSPYYPSWHSVVYYLARGYRGPRTPQLIAYILGQRRGRDWGSPLNTALAVSALVQMGHTEHLESAVAYLLEKQHKDGSWAAEAFWLDAGNGPKLSAIGSPALTTSLVLEAVCRFASQSSPHTAPQRSGKSAKTGHEQFYEHVLDAASREINILQPALANPSQAMLSSMDRSPDTRDIILLPVLFNESLIQTDPTVTNEMLTQLSLANLYGWMAYTIYDDFLDDEGKPQQLPTANFALRASLRSFKNALPSHADFQETVRSLFDTIDTANAWEIAHCRARIKNGAIVIKKLPSFGQRRYLADRSVGHALAPLGVLTATGMPPKSQPSREVLRAFRHYIIARQLSDDLHDWEADVRTGNVTYVVAAILKDANIGSGTHGLAQLIPLMQRHFWHHTLPRVCTIIQEHTSRARSSMAASRVLAPNSPMDHMIAKIDQTVTHTLQEQAKAKHFLAAYSGKKSH